LPGRTTSRRQEDCMTLAVELLGTTTKMAICTLRPGQTVYSEAGKFLFCSDDVTMTTRLSATSGAGSGAGGLGGLLRGAMAAGQRMLAGESFAFTYFTTGGGSGLLGLAGVLPGEMRAIELDGRTTWFAEKDAFVAAEAGVEFSIAFSGMRNGLQGGEGFVLEKFTGVGTLLIGGSGDFVDLNPADFGGASKWTPAASSPGTTGSATASPESAEWPMHCSAVRDSGWRPWRATAA
jgi:uncharacterized protein (AIM24 family)